MSIVKGASGNLKASANLVPNWDYSIVLWYKIPSNNFSYILDFINDSSTASRIYLRNVNTFLRHRLTLVGNRAANTTTALPLNEWVPVVIRSSSSDGLVKIDALGESIIQTNPLPDSWIPPVDPELTLFATSGNTDPVSDGSKLGVVAFYPYLSDTDTAAIIAGANPASLPSETAPIELWLDSTGVVKDGSNNLVSWTGANGTVLTPSGTVTDDDADLAPIEGGTPTPSITPSDPVVDGAEATITTANLSGAITATLGGYSLTAAGTLPNLTYTTDIASITANGPVSAPRIGESLTLSVTGDEGEATSTVATQAAAGMAVVTLAGTLANEADSLIDKMQEASGLTVAVGDIMYYPTADTTSIAATGALTTDSESFTLILIQGGSATTAGNAYAFTVTTEAVTPVEPGESDNTPVKKVKGVKMKAGSISSGKVSARKLSS